MSKTIQEIRRANLAVMIQEVSAGNQAAFSTTVEKSPSQISDMLTGIKSFGEKVARSLEVATGYPTYWLDHETWVTTAASKHLELDNQLKSLSSLAQTMLPIFEGSENEIREAITALLLRSQTDKAEGKRIAKAITALLGGSNNSGQGATQDFRKANIGQQIQGDQTNLAGVSFSVGEKPKKQK